MKALTLEKPLIFFDLETTGTDPSNDRIVEIATMKISADGGFESKKKRVNPGVPIPEGASNVHGITDEDVAKEPTFKQIAKSVAQYFFGSDLAGYNIVSFDIPMLIAEFERAGIRFDLHDVKVVDAFKIFTEREPRTLEGAVRFYCDKQLEGAHDALVDVQATFEVVMGQLGKYEDLGHDVESLSKASIPEGAYDLQGKVCKIDGKATITFGKHKGKTIQHLADYEAGYIDWILQKGVMPGFEKQLRAALNGDMSWE